MSVNATDVSTVLGETDIKKKDMDPYIDAAARMYDERLTQSNREVSTEIRDDVVTQLAAHLIKIGPERQVSSASESEGSVSYEGDTGQGLRATTHGQTAIVMDPTGELAEQSKPTASVSSVDFT